MESSNSYQLRIHEDLKDIKDAIEVGQFEESLEKLEGLDASSFPNYDKGVVYYLSHICCIKLERYVEALEYKGKAVELNYNIEHYESNENTFKIADEYIAHRIW